MDDIFIRFIKQRNEIKKKKSQKVIFIFFLYIVFLILT